MAEVDFDTQCARQLCALVMSWQTGVKYEVMLERLERSNLEPDDSWLWLANNMRRKASETFEEFKARRKEEARERNDG
jgi:hypothetical protein